MFLYISYIIRVSASVCVRGRIMAAVRSINAHGCFHEIARKQEAYRAFDVTAETCRIYHVLRSSIL